jgi:hypothetical protein
VVDANEHVATRREIRVIRGSQNNVANRNDDCFDEISFANGEV